jgi:hypothetical protein
MIDAPAESSLGGYPDYRVPIPPAPSRGLSKFYVSFGGGLKLVGEDWMIQEMRPLGLTRRSFRQLCKNLGVPLIRAGRSACVDFWSFVVALKAVTRIGQPDFIVPGARVGNEWKKCRHRIDAKEIEENRAEIVSQIVAGRAMSGVTTSKSQVKQLDNAVDRLSDTRVRIRGL